MLSGTSVPAIVLAATITATGSAVAQEITGNDVTTANLLAPGTGVNIISGATGGQFGAIDVNLFPFYNSITLTQSETISVFDSIDNGALTTINTDIDIASSAVGTLVFARSDTGNAAGHANMDIIGDLEGLNDSRGGGLAISGFEQSPLNASSLRIWGSTYMGALSIAAGDAVAGDGSHITATFGIGDNDAFDAFGVTVTGGNGVAVNTGGNTYVRVAADGTGDNIATFGTGGAVITGGRGGTDGDGGNSQLVIIDSATIAGAVTVTGGDEGTAAGNGGNATIDFSSDAGSVNLTGTLTIATGTDTSAVAGAAGNAEAVFDSTTVNANAGVVLSEQQNATAALTLEGTGDQTFNGVITAANDGDGEVGVNNRNGGGETIRFNNTIGTDARRIGTIDIDNDDTVYFQDNVFANIMEVDEGTAIFAGAMSVLEGTANQAGAVIIGNGSDAAMLTIAGLAAHTGGTTLNDRARLVIDTTGGPVSVSGPVDAAAADITTTLQTTGGNLVTFGANVGAVQPISLIDVDTDTRFTFVVNAQTIDVGTGITATLDGTSTVTGDITGDGTLALDNLSFLELGASGQSSTVSIANLGGVGADDGRIHIADGAMVTIETSIGAGGNVIETFSTGSADDTVLIINSGTRSGGETAIAGVNTGDLSMGAGTIVLGSNIGNSDTVFSFIGDIFVVTTANQTTTVQLSANFLETGDVITLAATRADQSAAFDDVLGDGELELTQTALTEYTLGIEDGAATGSDITITATARSTSDTADELGISEEEAEALREAVVAAEASGNDELLDALTDVLNDEDSTGAKVAAQSVGTQSDALGGVVQTAFALIDEQARTITGRLERARSRSGFSDGQLLGYYASADNVTTQAPTSSGGFWGQTLGGIAHSDGDDRVAGWNSAYGGIILGVDGVIGEDFTIGAFGSFNASSIDGDGAGQAQIDTSTFGLGVYAGYVSEGFYVDGFAAYAMAQNDLSRTAVVGAFSETVTADYNASQFSVGLAGGVPIEILSNLVITPNASLTWNRYAADGYTETGTLGQTVRPDAINRLTGTIGARIHAVYQTIAAEGTQVIPELRVALVGDVLGDDATAMVNFNGGGKTYQVSGAGTDDLGALIGFGLGFDNPDWAASLSYDADLRSDFMSHTARAELRWKF